MEISVVTPSLNMLTYLKCCAASIADQQGVNIEHIVVDGGSTDGTVDWLAGNPSIISASEKDKGMYDAINKGLRLAKGEILAYLNCDEQYLPETLALVRDTFACHPEIDILFGDVLVVNPEGELVAFRKVFRPRVAYILTSHLYTFSCAMFFRRKIVENGFLFNPDFKIAGDADWVIRCLRDGYRTGHFRGFLSVFVDTGSNLSKGKEALRLARNEYCRKMPLWLRMSRKLVYGTYLLEKFFRGAYHQVFPLRYAIYCTGHLRQRVTQIAESGTFRWRNNQ